MSQARQLVSQHGPKVWRTLCRLLGSDHLADVEDCFQEVFVAALELGRKDEVRNWEAMLCRIASRKGLDLLRTRIRQRARHNGETDLETVPAQGSFVSEALEQAELAADLRQALARLPLQEAELFCLRHLEEMNYAQIGAELNMTAGAVGVALHRIREKLRNWLGGEMAGQPNEVRHE